MKRTRYKYKTPKPNLRWVARTTSLISVGLMVFFLVGERFNPGSVLLRHWVGLSLFPIGVALGMIIGWWREETGGIIALVCLVAFYLIYDWLMGEAQPQDWAFSVFALPGLLFLIDGIRSRGARQPETP